MRRDRSPQRRQQRPVGRCVGFTLTELLVVIGLIAVLISLLLPVLGRARAAANATTCLSNLRQMSTAWTIYLTENRGRLPEYAWYSPFQPEVAYRSYWLGVLDAYKVRDDALLCPSAAEAIAYGQPLKGAGNATYAWSGKFVGMGTVIKLTPKTFRVSSYGYNKSLTASGGYGAGGQATRINSVRPLSEVPAFFDSVYLDAKPENGSPSSPVEPPDNLRGDNLPPSGFDHWRFLIARHGRGINIARADGSAIRVPLEETYMLKWSDPWQKYKLTLPPY